MRVVAIVFCTLTASAAQIAPRVGEQRLTNGAGVRLRAERSTRATVVRVLPFGTMLVVRRCDSAPALWCEVQTTDGMSGWVSAPLTTVVEPARPEEAAEAIVIERQARPRAWRAGSVDADLEVLDYVERVSSGATLAEARARWALYRLRAIGEVAAGIQSGRPRQDRYRQWLLTHADEVVYNEPGGHWLVGPEAVARAHDEHRATATADDMGWFLFENGLGGECEGDVPCYVERYDRLIGQYLRWHPGGRHVDEGVGELTEGVGRILAMTNRYPWTRDALEPANGCPELRSSLDALRAAVAPTTTAAKPAAFDALDRLAALCR